MPKKIAVTNLQASTMDILNVIRANASSDYQKNIPAVTKLHDVTHVGEVLYGYPALANEFINALINRIAIVRVKSMTFNNMFAPLKKGYLELGETVEEVFVEIAKAREFNLEKAESRELKRSLPDVRTAFHAMNYRVQYPVTVQDEDLKQAFLTMDGVQNLIAKIVDSVYRAAEYDEYLLFKYLIIKAVTAGKIKPIAIPAGDILNAAVAFRGTSNRLEFVSTEFNSYGVHTNTKKSDQYIFMDSDFNAQYDVNVLSAAFNMDKADFMGRLILVDSFSTFDNERFSEIVVNSDMIETVTPQELEIMKGVKAFLCDSEWFQFYDNNAKFTEKYVASGMYWNYFYNVWKTVSYSPFSNAVVFVDSSADIALPETITVEITDKSIAENAVVITATPQVDNATLNGGNVIFVQDNASTTAGIAIHKYGAIMFPSSAGSVTLQAKVGDTNYLAGEAITPATTVGTTITLTKQ